MSTITVRLPDELEKAMQDICDQEDRSKSWFVKKAVQEKIEDWHDLRAGLKALKKHRDDPRAISHAALLRELGLTEKDFA